MSTESTLAAVEALPSVTLDELNARATLLTRVDRKYLITLDALESLLADVDPGTRVLEIDGRRLAGYRSVYFDTPDLISYRQSAQRRRRRFKVRTRLYTETELCYLEVKTRGSRGSTVKDRVGYPVTAAVQLTARGLDYIGHRLAVVGITVAEPKLYPSLQTRYRRTTLLVPGPVDARVTIDRDLTWIAHDGRAASVPALAVVETKSGSGPSAVDRLLWSRGHRPVQLSKYGTGMAVMHPVLLSHKWHRLIQQRIRPALTPTSVPPLPLSWSTP